MGEATSIDQAVGAVAEDLLNAYRLQDPEAVKKALTASVLQGLDRQHPGFGNIHLAFAFARLLSRECPADARDDQGVPRMSLLVGDGFELPGGTAAHMAISKEFGFPASTAESKASNARFAEAIPLAQQFMRVWTLTPRAVADFTHAQSTRSPVMVDAVWGVLWRACTAVRSERY
ncbi:hypothetical protein [Nocardia sp. NPDC052566]|uniref:hypothetical protein n=1 Tax=Nocardia sp. NPDC052566 TaxID=3364330 RepID=UPI0037CB00CE